MCTCVHVSSSCGQSVSINELYFKYARNFILADTSYLPIRLTLAHQFYLDELALVCFFFIRYLLTAFGVREQINAVS